MQHKMTQRLDRILTQTNAPHRPIVPVPRELAGIAHACNVYDNKVVVTLTSKRLMRRRSFEHVFDNAPNVCALYTVNDTEMEIHPNRESWLSHRGTLIDRDLFLRGPGWKKIREDSPLSEM